MIDIDNNLNKNNIINNQVINNDFALKQYNIEMPSIEKIHSCLTVCSYIYWFTGIGFIFSIFVGWWPIVLIAHSHIKKSTKINLLIWSCIGLIPLISAICLIFMISIEQHRLKNIRKSDEFLNELPSMAN